MAFYEYLASKFPSLEENLKKAKLKDSPVFFVKKTFISSIYMTFGLLFIMFLLLAKSTEPKTLFFYLILAFPFFFIVMFFYFFQYPVVLINKLDREITKEVIYAGRFLVVELQSGVTLYKAMKNLSKSYPIVGAFFKEITDKIDLGSSIEDAVAEAIEYCPSQSLTKLLWQISNSLRTGSDVASPINTVVETLIKEQKIAVNDYARKLNPLAMFYMMIAIIMPSLGVTMITIVALFVGLKLDLPILLLIAFFIGFIQFMFVAMINSIRPPVEL
ncbi:MAG: type II secretion system F family protein [Candidatus Woesearchaeota archaeon]